ncbi:hypothetical protein ACH4SP_11710 [Streptomyces sp. NPDC021093]|uniref:hypothetical protein n=1 Tax=Streptomyces sp. NPDC021093 TaxID=3365112 RepID=UPI0037BCEAD8
MFVTAAGTAALLVGGLSFGHTALAQQSSGPEEHCASSTTKITGDGVKANVRPCVSTDGQFMKVKARADCFISNGYGGYNQYKRCVTDGRWTLSREGKDVAKGVVGGTTRYVGPGTYTLHLEAKAYGRDDNPGGSFQSGPVTEQFTFATPLSDLPFSVQANPAALAAGPNAAQAFTITRNSTAGVKDVTLVLHTSHAWPQGPRCNKVPQVFGAPAATVCHVKLEPGESTQVKVALKRPGQPCTPLKWSLTWAKNGREDGVVPCA